MKRLGNNKFKSRRARKAANCGGPRVAKPRWGWVKTRVLKPIGFEEIYGWQFGGLDFSNPEAQTVSVNGGSISITQTIHHDGSLYDDVLPILDVTPKK